MSRFFECFCTRCYGRLNNADTDYFRDVKEESMYEIRRGDITRIERMISCNSYQCPKDIFNLLHAAVYYGMLCIVKLLIPLIRNHINDLDEKGNTFLHKVLRKDYERSIGLRIIYGEVADWVDLFSSEPYVLSKNFTLTNRIESTRLFIDNGADLNALNRHGFTPLDVAVDSGYYELATLLLEKGADPNSGNFELPLHAAVSNEDEDIVRKLLYFGARVSTARSNGDTALHHALRGKSVSIQEALCNAMHVKDINISNDYGENVLHVAVKNTYCCNMSILGMLIAKGANVNSLDIHRDTPLMAFANYRCSKTFYNCEPGITRNSTVCHHKDITKLFIYNKCHLNFRNIFGHTVFHYALYNKRLCMIETLLQNNLDDSLLSELLLSIPYGSFDTAVYIPFMKYLIEYGADVNAKIESDGKTALHKAVSKFVSRGDTVLISYITTLIDLGADVNLVDNEGSTPLHVALEVLTTVRLYSYLASSCIDNILSVIKILLEAGANINVKSKDSITSFDIVRQFRNVAYLNYNPNIMKEEFYMYALKYFVLGWQPFVDRKFSYHYIKKINFKNHMFSECQKEVMTMKEIKVDGISLFDFIHPDNINNWEDLAIDFLENIDTYLIGLPNYRSIIKNIITRARKKIERQLILDSGEKFLNLVSEYHGLPIAIQDCYHEILKYLRFYDYKNLFALLKIK